MTAWKRGKRRDSGENPSAERGGGGLLRQPGQDKKQHPLAGGKGLHLHGRRDGVAGLGQGPADEGKDRFLGQRTDRGKLVVGEIEHRTGVNGGNGHGYLLRVEWMLPIIKHPGGLGQM